MLKQEFEERTGLQVSEEAYKNIDALYMATTLTKDEFCDHYVPTMSGNPIIVDLMRKVDIYKKAFDAHRCDAETYGKKILDIENTYVDDRLYGIAAGLMGEREAIVYKIENEYALGSLELEYIKHNLK